MKIREEKGKISALYVPVVMWILGFLGLIVFLPVTCFYVYTVAKYPNSAFGLSGNKIVVGLNILWFLFLVFALFAFIFLSVKALLSPIIKVVLNADEQTVEIIRRRFFHKTRQRFYFSQIGKFKVVSQTIKDRKIYYNCLKLVNNKIIEFEEKNYSSKDADGISSKFNEFLKKHKHSPEVENLEQIETDKTER